MQVKVYKNRQVVLDNDTGTQFENLATTLTFDFPDYVEKNGQQIATSDLNKYIVFDIYGENTDLIVDDKYAIPYAITKLENITAWLQLKEQSNTDDMSDKLIWISDAFTLKFDKSIESGIQITTEKVDAFNTLYTTLNLKIAEVDNIDIDATKSGNVSTVTITNKEGIEKSVNIEDGQKGDKGDTGSAGADAKINGVNTLTIEAGTNISLDQEGNTLTINSTGGGGTSDYTQLTNKPKINNVELNGNKTSSDLGLQPAGNYALESEIPTKTSDLTNDSGFITSYTETDPTVPSHVKNIKQANITSWNNKLDSSKVKNTNSTTAGDVYDVRYINNMIGDVETILTRLTIGGGVS